jgi:hypothetical protein
MLEYLDALARFAHTVRNDPDLTDDERQALDDVCWRSAAAQLGDGPDGEILTAKDRLVAAERRFLAAHDREPIPLSRRLRDRARSMFRAEKVAARTRARELRQGTTARRRRPPRPTMPALIVFAKPRGCARGAVRSLTGHRPTSSAIRELQARFA